MHSHYYFEGENVRVGKLAAAWSSRGWQEFENENIFVMSWMNKAWLTDFFGDTEVKQRIATTPWKGQIINMKNFDYTQKKAQ